jgi:protein SCO1/2
VVPIFSTKQTWKSAPPPPEVLALTPNLFLNRSRMNPPVRRLPWTMAIGVLLLLLTLALAFLLAKTKSRLMYGQPLPVVGPVADFTLTNRTGATVSLTNLHGHVWIADIIFTRCTGPCLRMSRQMKELQDALGSHGPARLVTLTTDPDYDTPAMLERYAERFDASTNRWLFLSGTKKQINDLAVGSLKLSAVEKPAAEREYPADLFVHSTIFVVVDRHSRLRGIFQTGGEGVDWATEKKNILAAVRRLEREP